MKTVSLARNAVATRFEMVLHVEDELGLRAAGEEALVTRSLECSTTVLSLL